MKHTALILLVVVSSALIAVPAAASPSSLRGRPRKLGSKAPGDDCKYDSDCDSGACAQGEKRKYVCCTGRNNWSKLLSIRQWCIKQPEGEACYRDDDQCAGNLFCNWLTNQCEKTKLANGAECGYDYNCASGNCHWCERAEVSVCTTFRASSLHGARMIC